MKKLLLIASALLAFTFFGCEQPSNSDTGSSDSIKPSTTIKATSAYAGPEWKVEDDWDSIKFVFAETPSNMQLKFTGEKVKAEQSWGIEYDATYSGLIESDSIEKKFSDMIPYMEKGSETVTHVSLVDMGSANGVAKIIKVEVTKTDDSTEELSIPDPSWRYTKE